MEKCKCWWRWPGDGNGCREVEAAIGGGWEIRQDGENLMALSRKKGMMRKYTVYNHQWVKNEPISIEKNEKKELNRKVRNEN